MIEKEEAREWLATQLQDNEISKHYDTCVILHLYYAEMWDEISKYLSNLDNEFDLIVTMPYGVHISGQDIKAVYPEAQVYRCENRGRDIAPFLEVFFAIANLGYKYVCKIHTKQSLHIADGSQWQEDMLGKLLGSRKIVSQIKTAFEKHSDWGLIAPQGHVVPHEYFWLENRELVIKLASSIDIPTETLEFSYVAGSMFWFRPEALSLLLKLHLSTQDFEPEQGQIDGTLAHALERFVGLAAYQAGYKLAESDSRGIRLPNITFHFKILIQAFQQREQTFRQREEVFREQKQALITDVSNINEQVAELRSQLSSTASYAAQKERELSEIYRSKAWRLIQIMRRLRLRLAPYGSTRERVMIWGFRTIGVIRSKGLGYFFKRIGSKSKQSIQSRISRAYTSKTTISQRSQSDLYVPIREQSVDPSSLPVKVIAFYLPQFHPIPENDTWWGKGFTEWTNVSKAFPNFEGHYQPHLPGELGFYDLRVPEVQQRQIELAKKYGIYGFCFYYYWFGGKRLLERPINQFLDSNIDFPFCLCWANENWTRRWDGAENEILIGQVHSEHEYADFIRDIAPFFLDKRYIRVEGKPLLVVYRVDILPNPLKAVEIWRTECQKMGIGDIYLVSAQSFGITDPRPYGFDAAVEFPPHNLGEGEIDKSLLPITNPEFQGRIFDYGVTAQTMMQKNKAEYVLFKTVMPSWDNTARKQNHGHIFIDSTPAVYKNWLKNAVSYSKQYLDEDKRFVFINAWNEWAEGTHLEPDQFHGYAFLQATADAITEDNKVPDYPSAANWSILFISHDAIMGGAQTVLLNTISWIKAHTKLSVKILCLEGGEWLHHFRDLADTVVLVELEQAASTSSEKELINQIIQFCNGKPDLIYGNTVAAGQAYQWLSKLGVPILTHFHELETSIKRYGGDWMKDIVEYSSHFIACSGAVRDNLIKNHGVASEKISVSYASIVSSPLPRDLGVQEKDQEKQRLGLVRNKYLIFGCGLGMPFRKGADLFIELGRILQRNGRNDFHLYWIGSFEESASHSDYGNWTNFLIRLKQSDLSQYVTFLGRKENPKEYLRLGDVFVLPSREDPFPLVALEAADCGLPIICFENAGGTPELVDGDAGYVVPYEDVKTMASKLTHLMDNNELRRQQGARAKEKFHSNFTVERSIPAALAACRKTADKRPVVSVIVPNYNHAEYLPQRLESIFHQVFQDFEVILLDDASSDNSLDVLKKYKNHGDVRILQNHQNSGSPFKQWIKGIDLARADIIWIAESDDSCEPDFLTTLLPAFKDPEVKLAYANSHIMNENSEILGDYLNSEYLSSLSSIKWKTNYKVSAKQEINDGLGVKNTILNISAVLFRRFEFEEELRRTLEGMHIAGDWYFIAHALKNGHISYNAKKLNYHRRHSKSVIGKTIQDKKIQDFFKEFYMVQKYIFSNYDLDSEFQKKWQGYLRQQWNDFYPNRAFEELKNFYPLEEMNELISKNATSSIYENRF